MEKHQIAGETAIRHMKLADHILTMTYPIVQDPKLLKLVFRNLLLSMENLMLALMYHEAKDIKIAESNEDFSLMVHNIKPILNRNNISREYINFLYELNNMVKSHKDSKVEFIRKDKFVFASEDYKLNIITKEKMREYIIKGKLFMKDVFKVIK